MKLEVDRPRPVSRFLKWNNADAVQPGRGYLRKLPCSLRHFVLKARPPSDGPVIVLTPLEFELYSPVLERRSDGFWYRDARVIISTPKARPVPR